MPASGPADRRDRQHPLASRPQHRQCRVPRRFSATPLYATTAIDGALAGFLGDSRARRTAARRPEPAARQAEVRRFLGHGPSRFACARLARSRSSARMRSPAGGSGQRRPLCGDRGRPLDLRCRRRSGDRRRPRRRRGAVHGHCLPRGWAPALDAIAPAPFDTLIPGHGAPMDRTAFLTWRAPSTLSSLAAGRPRTRPCVAGWRAGAAPFIPDSHRQSGRDTVADYIDIRLRASPEEQQRFCKPLKAG